MKKQDLQKLSKEQLEDILMFSYQQMDMKATQNKLSSDTIGIEEDPGYLVYHNALRTMCNLINAKINLELNNK